MRSRGVGGVWLLAFGTISCVRGCLYDLYDIGSVIVVLVSSSTTLTENMLVACSSLHPSP